MPDMLAATKALLEIDADGAASHPLPNAAVECMTWCVEEIRLARDALAAMIKLKETGVAEGLVDLHPDLEPVRAYLRHQ